MKLLKGAYWTGRGALAIPFWIVSGICLGCVELFLLLARSLWLGQMGFARTGNWLMWGTAQPDSVDMKIERRLSRLTAWRDKP